MKRLVTGLLLASVLLVAGVVSASAVSIYQDKNATVLINQDGSSAWVFVMNAGTTPVDALTITLYFAASIDLDHSYVYKADGTLVPFTLPAGSPRRYVAGGARTWALSEASSGRIAATEPCDGLAGPIPFRSDCAAKAEDPLSGSGRAQGQA
jgi:hypothetical protein